MAAILKLLFTLALIAYPVWMGSQQLRFSEVAVFAIVFAIVLFLFGPKSHEVQDQPSVVTMVFFALVLSAGLTGVGYGLGFWLFS
jgi:hypothetical protein